jgi:sirohydrochlorin ferrochelatase
LKEAILLIGHGSRAAQASDDMFRVAGMIRESGEFPVVECGFLQLCTPTIEEAAERCVAEGAEKIWMIPYFLHCGVHIRDDLPEVLRECRGRFPGVEMAMGDQLGDDPLLARVVMNRVREVRCSTVKES